jgi:hypothetical protein
MLMIKGYDVIKNVKMNGGGGGVLGNRVVVRGRCYSFIFNCLFSCSNFAVNAETRFCRNIFLRCIAECLLIPRNRDR